ENVLRKIKVMETQKQIYKYNFLGLIGVLLRVKIKREYALFCSQFVATILHDVEAFHIQKPCCLVTPGDIRNHTGMQLVYQGKLESYFENRSSFPERLKNGKNKLVQNPREIDLS